MRRSLSIFFDDLGVWGAGWRYYIERKLNRFGTHFERYKTLIVDLLVARRGTYQRPFLHISLGVLLIVGVMSAPILASAYPGGLPESLKEYTPSSAVVSSLDLSEYGIETQKSQKPRDQVEVYVVREGDTLSTISTTYGISVDTIKWANDIKGDTLKIDQALKIPPVTGVVHKVQEGDTVQSISKKYRTDAQKIVNFPFNDFADLDTFALNVGQTLIVPDGVPQAAPRPVVIPPAPFVAGTSGKLLWPTSGIITQYPIWYHVAYDIANPAAPGIMAADAGTIIWVEYLRYGYGQHIIIDHGGGLTTLYGHMQEMYVKPGDRVSRGQVIGRMGSTGRSTGTHLHFETRVNGVIVNPAPYFR